MNGSEFQEIGRYTSGLEDRIRALEEKVRILSEHLPKDEEEKAFDAIDFPNN